VRFGRALQFIEDPRSAVLLPLEVFVLGVAGTVVFLWVSVQWSLKREHFTLQGMYLKRVLAGKWNSLFSVALSLALGIIIGYFLSGVPILSPIAQWIGTSITLSLVFDLFLRYWAVKKEEHYTLMVSLMKHAVELKPSLEDLVKEPLRPSVAPMFPQASKHIESGYPELWNLLEGHGGIRETSNEISNIEKRIPEQIKIIIKKQMPSNLSISEFDVDWFAKDIGDSIDGRITDGRLNMFKIAESINIVSGRERRLLVYMKSDGTIERTYQVENLTEKDKEELAVILNKIPDEVELQKTLEHLHELRRQCNDKSTSFREQMNNLIEMIEHAVGEEDRVLLGKCKYCEK
jgi:hypothetical protein